MKDRQKYTVEAVQKLAAKLREMPEAKIEDKEVSKSEAIKLMTKEIKLLQSRGYTMKSIAEILSSNSFSISESVLKSYVQRAGSNTVATKRKPAKLKEEPATPVKALDVKADSSNAPAPTKKSNIISDVE